MSNLKILSIPIVAYHIGKTAFLLVLILPYVQWRTWRAKTAFKNELLKNGIPVELAENLADSYGNGNKSIIRSVMGRTDR